MERDDTTNDEDPPARGGENRYETWSGEPCPRCVRVDGTVAGTGACVACGTCLLGTDLV